MCVDCACQLYMGSFTVLSMAPLALSEDRQSNKLHYLINA